MRTHSKLTSALVPALVLGLAVALAGAATAPSDPLVDLQWHLDQIGAEGAWERADGEGTVIAIVDSGLDYDHPDLFRPDEADPSLNTKFVPGASFLGCGDTSCGDGDWEQGSDHGTHVAGIAAAEGDNGVGVAGVAPGARLMSVRVLDGGGNGTLTDAAHGIRWAVDNGADVINLSLGGLPGVEQLQVVVGNDPYGLYAAVDHALDNDVVVVAAAGNTYLYPFCSTPAYTSGMLCAVSTDKREARATYSNGAVNEERVSVAAPGGDGTYGLFSIFGGPLTATCVEGVLSLVPAGTALQGYAEACGYATDDLAYDTKSGTSMASPVVVGVAALLRSMGCDAAETVDLITATARQPVTGERGQWNPVYGSGIVDAAAATQAALTTCY